MLAYIVAFSIGYCTGSMFDVVSKLYTFFKEMPHESTSIFSPLVETVSFMAEYVYVRVEQWARRSVVWESENIYIITYVLGDQIYKIRAHRVGGPGARSLTAFQRGQKSLEIKQE